MYYFSIGSRVDVEMGRDVCGLLVTGAAGMMTSLAALAEGVRKALTVASAAMEGSGELHA